MFAGGRDGMEKWKWEKTKIIGWVNTLCVHKEQPAAMEKWKPPNQGWTAPRHVSRSVASIKSSLFPHALCRLLTILLIELESSSPYASALGSHSSLSLQDDLHKEHPFSQTKFKCSYSLAPKHFGFSSVITLFDWGLFPCLLREIITFGKPIPALSSSVSPCDQHSSEHVEDASELFYKMKLALLEQGSFLMNLLLNNTMTSPKRQLASLRSHDLLLMECKKISLYSNG